MADCADRRSLGGPPPQLFCAANLRWVAVAEHIVLLDLTEGVYDVIDDVGAAMWTALLQPPDERDIAGLAEQYGAPAAAVHSDFGDFAAAQLAAGRLSTERVPETAPPLAKTVPRRQPTMLRALRERASVERDLRKSFAIGYAGRTGQGADVTPPRPDPVHVAKTFRTADGLYPARDAPLDCLPRSLALTRFLRTAGWPAQHVVGVALHPFEAHAWVELEGARVNESDAYLRRFTVIQRA